MESKKKLSGTQSSSPMPFLLVLGFGLLTAVVNHSPGFIDNIQSVIAPLSFSRVLKTAVDAQTTETCRLISQQISNNTDVHWPGSLGYEQDIHHWASSAMEPSVCSVTPATTGDIAAILHIVGSRRTPFAISGGGHSLNPGFSSTTGIHISMSRFNYLNHDEHAQTIDIGAGLRWNDVFGYLNPKGYTVVGGRVNDVGVAGFILGGGLSWITNERGLTIDTLVSCEIVLPNGTVTIASADSHPDLFFGLKGGFNNFGIVTRFTLQTFPQGDIWGGAIIVPEKSIEYANIAISNFASRPQDPKATANIIYEYAEGELNTLVIVFYNAPTPPAGLYDEILAIPDGIIQASTMPFLTLLNAGQPRNTPRRIQDEVPIQKWTPSILGQIANETKFWGSYLEEHASGHFFDYVVEIFRPDYYSHYAPNSFSTSPTTASAWPADRSRVHYPLNIAFAWHDPAYDSEVYDALRETVRKLSVDAVNEGQDLDGASSYPNIVRPGVSLEEMYGGAARVDMLRGIRDVYDPKRVMDLTGGWHF